MLYPLPFFSDGDEYGRQTGTTITFSGTTTFAYKEWSGPLISVAGTNIKVTGTGTLDGLGAQYWDGEGSNGGKSMPFIFHTFVAY
jgi:polygalacturonase